MKTIEEYRRKVTYRYDINVRVENGEPHYVVTDRQTGAVTSCDYSEEDLNETIMELLGTVA